MSNPWEMYDRLIEGIPEDLMVDDYCVGCTWSSISAGGADGVALTVRQRAGQTHAGMTIAGQPLKEVAKLVKSWNFIEASMGMAAINAWYNSPERTEKLGLLSPASAGSERGEAFEVFGSAIEGKNVAVIGHFPQIEKKLAPICNLSILERDPQQGDYPDSACEYILPEQDYVFITGMTFTNKTLPRLLELCRGRAKVCIVGPSAPLSDILFDYGVYCVSGFCNTDRQATSAALRRGVKQGIFKGGRMVNYFAE